MVGMVFTHTVATLTVLNWRRGLAESGTSAFLKSKTPFLRFCSQLTASGFNLLPNLV